MIKRVQGTAAGNNMPPFMRRKTKEKPAAGKAASILANPGECSSSTSWL